MNRKLMMLLRSCVLASSISIFAQDAAKHDGILKEEETKQNEMKQDSMGNDEMKQDSMGHDSMKHDEMTEGKKQKKPTSPRSLIRGTQWAGWNEARRQRETKATVCRKRIRSTDLEYRLTRATS